MAIADLTVLQALRSAQTLGIDRLDAQLMLLHVMGRQANDRAWLMAHDGDTLSAEQASTFQAMCRRRLTGEPVAYLVGAKEFFGLALKVDKRVLVPRPDTETLVLWSLDVLDEIPPDEASQLDVIDLGTGSGAIALALAQELARRGRHAHVVGLDASAEALEVARANAKRLKLAVDFVQGRWLATMTGEFHLIASNPPYIASADPHLAALTHEPIEALTSGVDGLDDLRLIVRQAGSHLLPGGWLLLEHGYDQAAAVRQLLTASGFNEVQSRCDLAGIERCSGGRWPARPAK